MFQEAFSPWALSLMGYAHFSSLPKLRGVLKSVFEWPLSPLFLRLISHHMALVLSLAPAFEAVTVFPGRSVSSMCNPSLSLAHCLPGEIHRRQGIIIKSHFSHSSQTSIIVTGGRGTENPSHPISSSPHHLPAGFFFWLSGIFCLLMHAHSRACTRAHAQHTHSPHPVLTPHGPRFCFQLNTRRKGASGLAKDLKVTFIEPKER